ncbi:MAG: FHA domain-containing protein, partial [Methylococcaceae bacterium]
DTSQPNFLMRLWYRDPFMLVIFSAVLLLSYVLIRLLYQQKKPVTSGSLKPALAQHNRPPFATGLARLYCLTGPYAGNSLELDNKPLTIGRDPELCQLVMPSTLGSIGRRHCSITFNKNTQCFWLEDHGSTNGTFLKAQRLTPGKSQRLESGDHFYLDSLENEFKVGLGE